MPKTNKKKGFTLLEILLVIAAIGILAAIVLVAINPNRQLAQVRNAERRSEINTIYKAIEQYLIDKGSYPTGITTSIQDICNTGSQKSTDTLSPTTLCDNKADLKVLVPDYIAAIPIDPQGVAYKVAINGANNRVSVYASNVELGQIIGVNNAWTPAQLPGLSLWLDAADASTITLNGSTVSQWSDKSGNGRHISQATASQQPTWDATGLNSKPILTFDGTNDVLLNASVGASELSNVTIISVFRQISGAASEDHQINIGQTGTNGRVRGFYRSPSSTVLQFGGWASVATSTLSLDIGGTHHIFGFANSALSGAGNVLLMRDGEVQTLTTSTALATTLDGFSVGSLQGSAIGSYYSNISVSEIVVLYNSINTLDRQRLEGYLAHKWGLVHNLPANHPYRWDGREFGYTFSGITDTDAQTYIAGVERADGQVLESGTRTAIQNFIVGAKADGIWDAIKSSAILAGARTLNGALVPLKGTAPTNFNFVSGDYNRKTGLVGNGSTKYLDSNRANNADPTNSQHLAAWIPISAGGNYIVSADVGLVGGSRLSFNFTNSRSNVTDVPLLVSNVSGLVGLSRNSSSSYVFRGKQTNTIYSRASQASTSSNLTVFVNITGTQSQEYYNGRIAFYSIGESLDLALLDARVTTLINAIGAAIP